MGRKRRRAASIAALQRTAPAQQILANSMIRIAFSGGQADDGDRPTLKYVVGHAGHDHRRHRAQRAHRHDQQHGRGIFQLSYSATSTRNTTSSASASSMGACEPVAFSWNDRPVHS